MGVKLSSKLVSLAGKTSKLLVRLLRYKISWLIIIAAIILSLISWRDCLRYAYAYGLFPLRSAHYYLSPSRHDALYIWQRSGHVIPKLSFERRLGLWAVLVESRADDMNLEEQAMLLAVVQQESNFRFTARNPKSSACGLYQFVRHTGQAKALPWWACMDPIANAAAGARIFRDYRQRGGFSAKNLKSSAGRNQALRCTYLLHYYGINHGCKRDEKGIWSKTGSKMQRRTDTHLRAVHEIEERKLLLRRGYFIGVGIIGAAIFLLFYLKRRRRIKKTS